MNGRLVGFLAVVISLSSGAARGASPDSPQPADEWRGRRVLAASSQVVLREQPNSEAAIVPLSTTGLWFSIKRSDGGWLEADYGWLRAADVVRDDQAVEFFTAELARGESAFAYVSRSRAWLEKKEFDKAQADVSEALRLEPNNARAYFARSRIAAAQERTEDERAACDRALAIEPRDPSALEVRASLRAEAREYDAAIDDLTLAIGSLPKNSRLWSGRGFYWQWKGDDEKAFADFGQAVQLDPLDAYSLCERAAICTRRQEFDRALEYVELALKVNAKMPRALAIRGVVHARNGEFDAALKDLDESIRLDAGQAIAFNTRGRVRCLKGEYDAALIDFTQAISLNPDDFDSYARRSEIWSRKGDDANTILDITQYLRHRPKDANALAHRGWLLKETDADAALKDLNAALEIDPRHVRALLARARVWKDKNELAKAIDDSTAAIVANPRNAEAYTQRGWLRSEIDVEGALKDLDAALEINPRHVGALLQRADVWEAKQEPVKAIADLTMAIEIEPANRKAHWKRAELHSSLQKHRLAVDDLTAALKINPGDASCLLRRSLEWSLSGNLEPALEDCRAALAIEPKNLMAYYYMAIAHEHAGQIDRAVEDFAAALRIDPQDDEIRFLFAYQLSRQDKLDQAFAQLDEVIRHGKRVAHAYNWRGYLWMQRREWGKALAALNEAIRLEPRVAGHWRMRADCRYGMKEFDQAIKDADEALRLDPKSEDAAQVRRQALEAKRDPSKAEDPLMTADEIGEDALVTGLSPEQFAAMYKVELRGPAGLKLAFWTGRPEKFASEYTSLPIRLPMLDNATTLLKLFGFPGNADASLYLRLEAKELMPPDISVLRASKPSVTLTQADLDAALSGQDVNRILVLRHHESEPAKSELEIVSSAELNPGADLDKSASQRGVPVAVLRLSKRPLAGISTLPEGQVTAIRLSGPGGLKVTFEGPSHEQFENPPIPAPAVFALPDGVAMHFKLSSPPAGAKEPLYARLKLPPARTPKVAWSGNEELPITLSQGDLDAARAGKLVTYVVYLASEAKDGDVPETQTLISSQLEPGEDPVAEASKRGMILAVLRLSNKIANLPAEMFPPEASADPTERPAPNGEPPLEAPKR